MCLIHYINRLRLNIIQSFLFQPRIWCLFLGGWSIVCLNRITCFKFQWLVKSNIEEHFKTKYMYVSMCVCLCLCLCLCFPTKSTEERYYLHLYLCKYINKININIHTLSSKQTYICTWKSLKEWIIKFIAWQIYYARILRSILTRRLKKKKSKECI